MRKIKKTTFVDWGDAEACPEDFAINNLRSNSPEFKSFYQIERNKIKGKVFWAQYHKLPVGTRGMACPLRDGNNVVFLPTIPIPLDRAFMAAHELGHLVRRSESDYFAIGAKPGSSPVVVKNMLAINSMMEDHRVNAILVKHGYDLKAEFGPILKNQMGINSSSNYFPDEVEAKTVFVNHKLCCDLIREDFQPWLDFETHLRSKFPELSKEIDKIYNLVKENSFQTPERKELLLKAILEKHNKMFPHK
jgi:hypothetical protein